MTDANLFLGRLLPDSFPKIFGPNEDEALDIEITRNLFQELTDRINDETGQQKSPEEVALGFIEVSNENMVKPIRLITEARGFDTSAHNLACFGGAGGQHACAMASSLGVQKVIVHKYSSILSAYGMALADLVHEAQEPASGELAESTLPALRGRIEGLKAKVTTALAADGVEHRNIHHEVYLNVRYKGTDNTLMISEPADGDFLAAFNDEHKREFGFTFPERSVLVEDIRVRGVGSSSTLPAETPHKELRTVAKSLALPEQQCTVTKVTFAPSGGRTGPVDTPVFELTSLLPGQTVAGPAILLDSTQTLVVEPGATATILSKHVVIEVPPRSKKTESAGTVDPIRLSVFGNR